MMGPILNNTSDKIIFETFTRTPTTPRIQITISPNNSRSCIQFFISNTTKMIQCVFIIRLDPIILFALFGIELIIKISLIEHILLPIHSHRHSLIPTSKYIPSTHIFIRCLITKNLIAFCAVVTVKILDRLPQSIKKFFIIRFHRQITIDQRET